MTTDNKAGPEIGNARAAAEAPSGPELHHYLTLEQRPKPHGLTAVCSCGWRWDCCESADVARFEHAEHVTFETGTSAGSSQPEPDPFVCDCGHRLGTHTDGKHRRCTFAGCGCDAFVAESRHSDRVAHLNAGSSQTAVECRKCGHLRELHRDPPASSVACIAGGGCICTGWVEPTAGSSHAAAISRVTALLADIPGDTTEGKLRHLIAQRDALAKALRDLLETSAHDAESIYERAKESARSALALVEGK